MNAPSHQKATVQAGQKIHYIYPTPAKQSFKRDVIRYTYQSI